MICACSRSNPTNKIKKREPGNEEGGEFTVLPGTQGVKVLYYFLLIIFIATAAAAVIKYVWLFFRSSLVVVDI